MICNMLKECIENRDCNCERRHTCVEFSDKRPMATCAEKGKRYNLVNDKNCLITQYHVDGGLVYDDKVEQRCDYLYVVHDTTEITAILVELKGKDIKHAVEQLEKSANRFGRSISGRMFGRIVCSAVPRLYNDPAVKNLEKIFRKCNGGNLVLASSQNYEEKYSKL